MNRAVKWGFGLFFVFLFLVLVLGILIMRVANAIPSEAVLVLELGGEIDEQRPGGLAELTEPSITLVHHVLDSIDKARTDDRITGLVLKITPLRTGRATLQEIRQRVLEFRKSNKPTLCYLHADNVENAMYYLGTACEQVWMVPTASLGLTGMMAESLFVRGTLDKLNIKPNMFHIDEYKTAMNMFTERKYTPAHREMAQWLLKSAYDQFVNDNAAARKMEPQQFDALARSGPYLTQQALENKLVDRAAYWDEVQQFFKDKSKEWQPVRLGRYAQELDYSGADKIAIVHATGTIVVGKSDYSPLLGHIMGSDSVAADIRRARENKSIKAIVLRVDSGGGSAVASEIIRREAELAMKEKPFVVSMSDVAGSGGYWISTSSHKIVADPTTITASIGVVYGKMNISGLYNMLGLSVDHLVTSDNANLMWPHQDFTPQQAQTIQRFMYAIYDDFLDRVAKARNLSREQVDNIGQGRVFTGTQAKDLGLVDEIGGIDRALALAKELAKIPADKKVGIVRYPERIPWWKQLLDDDSRPTVYSWTAELKRIDTMLEPIQARMPFEIELR